MDEAGTGSLVRLWLAREGALWFGLGARDEALVATATGKTREEALRFLLSSLPHGAPYRLADEATAFFDSTVRTLAALEAGEDVEPRFRLAGEWIDEASARVFRLAASIPRGYACSYGRLAAAAGVTAREVGRLMARNPLYPLVPCHRVVGSDYALVGYRGATSGPDLDDKLVRLRAEARGYKEERELGGEGGILVFPVERVLARVEGAPPPLDRQLSLW